LRVSLSGLSEIPRRGSDLHRLQFVDTLDSYLFGNHLDTTAPTIRRLPETSLHRPAYPDTSTGFRCLLDEILRDVKPKPK
jgi:hypothetical protein